MGVDLYKKTLKVFGAVLATAALLLSVSGTSEAGRVVVSSDISTSTTWTADNFYQLDDQIYVLPGATLTIQAGTVIASTPTVNGAGSLAVTRGAQIFVNGTADNPVIMTSTADVATWAADPTHPTGKDPRTGMWREAALEWGNLTIMGEGLISASIEGGGSSAPLEITVDDDQIPGGSTTSRFNTSVPDGLNQKTMEGLTAGFLGDARVLYGGADDNDDSGSISYLSIRYGGRVIGLADELNGLSLGGIGRGTDIHHVEIMNNVDDGIEIWGGTVNLKYVSIWNIGDDSFDIDQGWRGKAQFGLIVQGYSLDAGQGSGVGDNCFETDGAEDSDAQPITTATVYNFTAIGQPDSGDGGTTWRDNARVQYRNCIFMDLGERLVRFDDSDGDGAAGYGNGQLSWADTWTTPYSTTPSLNIGTADPAVLYQVQSSGNLAEITDSVFYNNNASDAYTEADARGVRDPGNNNVTTTSSPIVAIAREPLTTKGGLAQRNVISINPTAKGAASNSVATAPNDGFFTPVSYRGGFSPIADQNWLVNWTATDAFGFLDTSLSTSVESWDQYR